MSETYDEIIKETKECDHADGASEYCNRHGIDWAKNADLVIRTTMALDIAARVREAVAGDPSEWWVEDADGNHVHIGDKFEHYDNTEHEVFALGPERVIFEIGNYFNSVRSDLVHKVVPDTREKIIEDTIKELADFEPDKSIIEQAVDRAMKLGAGQ